MSVALKPSDLYTLDPNDLGRLFTAIQDRGYAVAGPSVRDGAIAFGVLREFNQLPRGFVDDQQPGQYRLKQAGDESFFRYTVGPQSIKNVLHPPQQKLWSVTRSKDKDVTVTPEEAKSQKLALFGIRSCEVKAIEVLDRVFLGSTFVDQHYARRRKDLLIITATCLDPAAVCFCTSMGHGPHPESFDINLTESLHDGPHRILATVGSDVGRSILESIKARSAPSNASSTIATIAAEASAKITKTLPQAGLPEFIQANLDHPHWDKVAERCLSCANCTMVCPTCFCSTVEDKTAVTGDHSERWLRWDSCFTSDHSYIHGGKIHASTKSRYRQWLSHKLSSWHEQFGTSGCVGCGRCVAWCPVGIDITAEVKAMRGSP